MIDKLAHVAAGAVSLHATDLKMLSNGILLLGGTTTTQAEED